jgi:hypothetical protein
MENDNRMKREIDKINKASQYALRKIQYSYAHNKHILYAIEIVEDFLRKKHRLCYGGQAINAHLPTAHQFYDQSIHLPDYDFYSPQQESDIRQLIRTLQKAGFQEIAIREGMHEGTLKIYVDYVSVADITALTPKIYRILSKNEFRKDGISYLDANTLRMLMYVELSRPRGEVERWPKVYERLYLFNQYVSWKPCHHINEIIHGKLTEIQISQLIQYIIENEYVFAGGDLIHFYRSKKIEWIIGQDHPIVFFSIRPEEDSSTLQHLFPKVKIRSYHSTTPDLIPSMTALSYKKNLFVLIIHTSACHSYYTIRSSLGTLRIASLDTLIVLYFGLRLVKSSFFDIRSIECLASQMVLLSMRLRRTKAPFISLHCYGHQYTLPSLIRYKVKRIMTKRKRQTKNYSLRK